MADIKPEESPSLLDIIGIEHLIEDQIRLQANIVLRRSAPPDFLQATYPDLVHVF